MKFLVALVAAAVVPTVANAQYLIIQIWNDADCTDAGLYYFEQYDTGSFLTNFPEPGFAFKVIENTGDCVLTMYSEADEEGISAFVDGGDMDVGACTWFTDGYPIVSILSTCS